MTTVDEQIEAIASDLTKLDELLTDVLNGDSDVDWRHRCGAQVYEKIVFASKEIQEISKLRPDDHKEALRSVIDQITALIRKLLVSVFDMPEEDISSDRIKEFVDGR